jgi:1-acyl-sn-glycerol-3-phosphate acyltransferase
VFYWILRTFAWCVLSILYAVCGGLRIEGREHVPRKGGVLITPNHISFADPPTVARALPRSCYAMAWDALFKIPVLGTLMRWLRGFPVKPGTADRGALRRAEELLQRGEVVVMFPEGGVSKDGALKPMLPGVIMVAQRAKVPIVPTIVIGTNKMMPYEKVIPRHAHQNIVVRFGPPVTVEELTGGEKGGAGYKRGAQRLYDIMLALQQGRPYPEPIQNESNPSAAKFWDEVMR